MNLTLNADHQKFLEQNWHAIDVRSEAQRMKPHYPKASTLEIKKAITSTLLDLELEREEASGGQLEINLLHQFVNKTNPKVLAPKDIVPKDNNSPYRHQKLAKEKIYSKVVSVPCQDIFDLQSKSYKKKILDESKFKISIEAASTDCWKKYVGTSGLTFGIDAFGKSAPYKEIYKYFGLTVQNISQKTKKLIKN